MIPAAAVMALLIMVPPVLKEFNSNLSTLLPFSRMNEYLEEIKGEETGKSVITVSYSNPFEIPPVHPPESKSENQLISDEPLPDTSEMSSENDATEVTPVSENQLKSAVAPDEKSVSSKVPLTTLAVEEKEYFVIGGCFQSKENADNFVAQMKSEGMDAVIIGQNKANLYMVSLFNSQSLNQITDALPEIKNNLVESAWVFKK